MKQVDKEKMGGQDHALTLAVYTLCVKIITMDPNKMDSRKVGVQFPAVREILSSKAGRNRPHV
jgi:hypothetical protein